MAVLLRSPELIRRNSGLNNSFPCRRASFSTKISPLSDRFYSIKSFTQVYPLLRMNPLQPIVYFIILTLFQAWNHMLALVCVNALHPFVRCLLLQRFKII